MKYVSTNGPLNGLFYDISQRLGEEALKKSVFLTGTEKYEDSRGDPNVIILPSNNGSGSKNNWHSIDTVNATLYIYLKYFNFLLTEYTIKSRNDHYEIYPNEYVLHCSKNNRTWNLLHYFNSTELSQRGAMKTFTITSPSNRACKYFRFIQMRTDLSTNFFVLNRLEFFGVSSYGDAQSCRIERKNHFIAYVIIVYSIS